MTLHTFGGYLQAFSAVFFWSFNTILATLFLTDLTPIEFAFGRWFFAMLILLPMAWEGLKQNYAYLLKRWKWVVALAVTGIVLDNTLIYIAARTTTPVEMGLLNALGPVFLCLLTWIFLRAPVYKTQVLGILSAFAGVVIIVSKGKWANIASFNFSVGDWWMILNAFCFALYSFLQYSRPAFLKQRDLLAATVVMGAVILLPVLLWQTPIERLKVLGSDEYSVLLYLGVFNSVIAYLMWNTALNAIGTIKTGIVYYLMPVLTMAEAVVILHEHISWAEAIGGLVVLIGIAVVGMGQHTRLHGPIKNENK